MNLTEYVELLGITPGEFVGMFWKKGDHRQTAVVPADTVNVIADHQIPRDHDAYMAPNPTAGPARLNAGRGTEDQVTRVAALYADLDVKTGACQDINGAHVIVDELSSLLGERPGVIIFSGGGLQPIWVLDDCTPETGRGLLRRFGRLTKVVGQLHHAALDSVFDTARVLRIPGSLNHKYGVPIEVIAIPDTGGPMDPATVDERLDEAGIFEAVDDETVGCAEIVAAESGWGYAVASCGYSAVTISAWCTEAVTERHPWLLKTSVRLECMRRNGCLTRADYQGGLRLLENRFRTLCSGQEPRRAPARFEIRDIGNEAIDRASRKTPAQLDAELGNRDGTGHVHLLGGSCPPPQPTEVAQEPPAERTGPGIATMDTLEGGFWDARESLQTIYGAALARMCSPWAVLACCVARALATVRPNATLPALIGGVGSLNWFGAVAAPSGGGKGSSLAVARDLIDVPVYQRNLGSGEGMVTAFKTRPTDQVPGGTRESVMFVADEIDNVSALGARNGSTLMATLRSAFCAETLGFSYAGAGKNIHLDAHTYRLTLVCGIQPGRAAAILNDDAGGTPQRFMWFPGVDHRITRHHATEYQWTPFGLTIPSALQWQYPREIILPPDAHTHILDERVRAMNGQTESLDGHAIFAREKFAYALTVLDGRVTMTQEDWDLSEVAANISRATRDWVASEMTVTQRRDAERRGEMKGVEAGAADEAKLGRAQARSNRIAKWVLHRLADTNGDGITRRDLILAAASRDRNFLQGVMDGLVAEGVVVSTTDGPNGGIVWHNA